jgi:hypothetical protein
MKPPSTLTASWIWRRLDSYTPYHQAILARQAQVVPGTLEDLDIHAKVTQP